jgi:hypothetical protein
MVPSIEIELPSPVSETSERKKPVSDVEASSAKEQPHR